MSVRHQAREIWDAAVRAVDPFELTRSALMQPQSPLSQAVAAAPRVLVLGGGKAGAAMAAGVEAALPDKVDGLVNVPAEAVRPLRSIRLHAARPAGTNYPTAEGVAGTLAQLEFAHQAGPNDLCLCLLSGGGSALLPAPVEGISLEDKQQITRLLHSCGATIDEMNCVRKHLSRYKGGGLARGFRGQALFSLILSDVIADPLDVIASGPTALDPTTFDEALAILRRYSLTDRAPPAVMTYLQAGAAGHRPDTLKQLPAHVHNLILGNNARALQAAEARAKAFGYHVLNLGSFLDGETAALAGVIAALIRSIRRDGRPCTAPLCLLSGGETTVTLPPGHGKGGRNQEFVLALAHRLGRTELKKVTILSGGTDGEDGPTDAAGAYADVDTLQRAYALGLVPEDFLVRHDAYAFFEKTGDLLKTGLTGTNMMDVRVLVIQ